MSNVLDAVWAETIPDLPGNEGSRYFKVGEDFPMFGDLKTTITRITVQEDEPGLHGYMRRVCVWTNGGIAVDFPFIAAAAVGYQ